MQRKLTPLIFLILVLTTLNACSSRQSSTLNKPAIPAATPLPDDSVSSEEAIRFLEARIKKDPDDMVTYNILAGRYLQRLRETGSVDYLDLARRAVESSLKILPQDHNLNGFTLLTEVEYASHDFTAAQDHAKQLMDMAPNKVYPYQMLGDTMLELGNYDKADSIYKNMVKLNDNSSNSRLAIETRLARLETLNGNVDKARNHFLTALSIASNMQRAPRENIAWCRWQLGENAFAVGDYPTAEQHYKDALTTFPDYFRACASLGRVRAAQGDLAGAIKQYERAVQIVPDPIFVAALGDLYQLTGHEKEAQAQYALVEQIGKLSTLAGVLYNRNIALFYADHDLKAEVAYTDAAKEYAVRPDIYGADALAWTALKAGKLTEAQTAIKQALRLGTKDAKLFYHAGMIAHAAGDQAMARSYLQQALKLNPQFDPRQAPLAQKTLAELGS